MLENAGQVFLIAQHQQQVNFVLGFEMLVDSAFANTHPVRNHFHGHPVFAFFQKKGQSGIENLTFSLTKFLCFTRGFFQITHLFLLAPRYAGLKPTEQSQF